MGTYPSHGEKYCTEAPVWCICVVEHNWPKVAQSPCFDENLSSLIPALDMDVIKSRHIIHIQTVRG